MELYRESRDAWGNTIWPDGAPLLDQPVLLTQAFVVIGSEMRRYEKKR